MDIVFLCHHDIAVGAPDTNYQVPGEDAEGGKFVLNVCRSIMHAKNISCPYHSLKLRGDKSATRTLAR